MGKQRRVLPSEQSITVPSWATGCNGANMRSKTACRTSVFICRCVLSARADLLLNFGGTGNNARRRTGILTRLFLVCDRMLPTIIYTGQAFLLPEKLVR